MCAAAWQTFKTPLFAFKMCTFYKFSPIEERHYWWPNQVEKKNPCVRPLTNVELIQALTIYILIYIYIFIYIFIYVYLYIYMLLNGYIFSLNTKQNVLVTWLITNQSNQTTYWNWHKRPVLIKVWRLFKLWSKIWSQWTSCFYPVQLFPLTSALADQGPYLMTWNNECHCRLLLG